MADDVARRQDRVDPGRGPERLDTLNLEQALVDLDLANGRVIDLTGRVTSLSEDVLRLRAEVGNLQLVLAQERAESERQRQAAQRAQAELTTVRGSRAFRIAQRAGRLRTRLARR